MEFSYKDKRREKEILRGLFSNGREGAYLFFKIYGGIIKKAVSSVDMRSNAIQTEDLFLGAIENLLNNDMKALRTFNGNCKLSTFLFTISRRYALSIARRENLIKNDPFSDNISIDQFDDIVSFDETHRKALREAINQCDIDTQLFIRMVFFDHRPTAEVMNFFGWNSENTVYSKKNKTIARLRKSMGKILINRKK